METLGTLSFKFMDFVEVQGTGLGIIVAGLLVLLALPKIRARK